MQLSCDPVQKAAVQGLFSQAQIQPVGAFSFEDTPLAVSIVNALPNVTAGQFWLPADMTNYSVRAAIGNPFLSPIAGTWFILSGITLSSGSLINLKRYQILTYGAGDDFTNVGAASNAAGVIFISTGGTPTTWTHFSTLSEISPTLQWNASVNDVQMALNSCAWMGTAGGGTVSGSGTYFFITFTQAGPRTQMQGNGEGLAPLSFVEAATKIDGVVDGVEDVQEVQTLRLLQQPAAYAVLGTDSPAAGASIAVNHAGGSGFNHKVTLSFNAPPYDGSFTVTVAGLETSLQPFNVAAADLATAIGALTINAGTVVTGRKYIIQTFVTGDDFTNIGALSNATGVAFVATGTTPTTWTHQSVLTPVGSGNVQVGLNSSGSYMIAFQGVMANTDMGTIGADGSTLSVQSFKTGILSTNTEAMELLLGTADTISTTFEIEATPSGGNPVKIFRANVTVVAPLIHGTNIAGPTVYFYDKAQVDALLAGKVNLAWQVKTANFTAAIGGRYQIDTSGGAVTMTLPIGMAAGDSIQAEDATYSWGTNALTIAVAASGFGTKINGGTSSYADDVIGDKLSLVGISSGQGVSIK